MISRRGLVIAALYVGVCGSNACGGRSDLGSWHIPLDGSATLQDGALAVTAALTASDDGTALSVATSEISADSLGLEDGNVYPLTIFNAEREVQGSTFKFAVSGIDGTKSTCAPGP